MNRRSFTKSLMTCAVLPLAQASPGQTTGQALSDRPLRIAGRTLAGADAEETEKFLRRHEERMVLLRGRALPNGLVPASPAPPSVPTARGKKPR